MDAFNWLNNKTILGYNASKFVMTLFIILVTIIIVSCLVYLFYLMYKLVQSNKKFSGYKEKIFIVLCTYLLVTINISVINLYLLYFDKNAFSDFNLSNNSLLAVLDSLYFTIKNFIAIGGNEANSILAKIIVICTTCINIYYFVFFIPMLLSKKESIIMSNSDNGLIITQCQFNSNHSERYQMDKIWNEKGKKAIFIGINPSHANGLKEDKTIMNIINYLVDCEYGSITILNLFSIIDIENKSNEDKYATHFEKYTDIFEKTDLILIGWGCEKRKYSKQKKSAELILKPYSDKVFTFVDKKDRQAIHPSKILNEKQMVKYNFIYINSNSDSKNKLS